MSKAEFDPGERPGDARDLRVGRDPRGAVGRAHAEVRDDVGVGVANAHRGRPRRCGEKTTVEQVHGDRCGHVAAVDAPVDLCRVGGELQQCAGEVGIDAVGVIDQKHLVRRGEAASESGGLTVPGSRAALRDAHDVTDDLLDESRSLRQRRAVEHDAGRGTSAHVVHGDVEDTVALEGEGCRRDCGCIGGPCGHVRLSGGGGVHRGWAGTTSSPHRISAVAPGRLRER